MKKLFLLFALLAVQVTFGAAIIQDAGDFGAASIVEATTPLIVLAAAWGFNKLWPSIPSLLQLTLVAGLSALLAWLTTTLDATAGFWPQLGIGLAATFIHQFYKKAAAAVGGDGG